MDTFLNSVSSVFTVMLMMAAGWAMGRLGWFRPEHKKLMFRLIIYIGIPAMCINSFQKNFTRNMLAGAAAHIAAPMLSILLIMAVSMFFAKALKLSRERVGVYITMACLSNSIFIGYPMCRELFGDQCLPYVMWYYMCNTLVFQSVGVGLIANSGQSTGAMLSPKGLVNAVKNPPFIAAVAAVLLLLLDIRLPRVLMSLTENLGSVVSPLGLLYSGYIVYETGFKNLRPEKGLLSMLLMRFVLSPLVCILLCRAFGITGLAMNTYTVEMSMPTMTQTVVMSAAMGADEHYAAKGAVLSILASFVVIPVLMLAVQA